MNWSRRAAGKSSTRNGAASFWLCNDSKVVAHVIEQRPLKLRQLVRVPGLRGTVAGQHGFAEIVNGLLQGGKLFRQFRIAADIVIFQRLAQ